MNRQQDVIMLFDFLIELLKEKNNITEEKPIVLFDANLETKKETDEFSTSLILELMRKVNSEFKQKTEIQAKLKEQESKIKKMEQSLDTEVKTTYGKTCEIELEKD
jgi:hypothetical protein